jgi:hypothetical protein
VLIERTLKEKYIQYLTIIFREVDYEDYQNREGGMVYEQIILNAKLQRRRRRKRRRRRS